MDPVEIDGGRTPGAPPALPGTVPGEYQPIREFSAEDPASRPGHGTAQVPVPDRLPAAPWRYLIAVSGSLAAGATGLQIWRLLHDEPRLSSLSWGSLVAGVVCLVSILVWTWSVVENARRLLAPSSHHALPDPGRAVANWIVPFVFVVGAATLITIVSRRLNQPEEGLTSSLPFLLIVVCLVVGLAVMYHPLSYLSGVVRQLGGATSDLTRWSWVPVAMAVVGAGMIVALRLGGVFEEEFDGVAPPWALAVVALPIAAVIALLGWRGAIAVEDAVDLAYDRRRGVRNAGVGRGRASLLTRALRADAMSPITRDVRKRIRLVPGANPLRLALVTSIAALALLSIVGAVVMFLFWREAQDGVLIQSQRDRAWDVLGRLQRAERLAAFVVVGIAMAWSFVNVLNARLATGRRRNPLLAALAWPAAAVGIWMLGDWIATDAGGVEAVAGFAAQIAVLYVPFFLLERAAITVGAARGPFRVVFAFGAVLLVHIQGLAGLSTLEQTAESDRFGRLAGYLALGAVLELLSTLAVTEASRRIAEAAQREADEHNFLADQRTHAVARTAAVGPAPVVGGLPAPAPTAVAVAPPPSAGTVIAAAAPPPPPPG